MSRYFDPIDTLGLQGYSQAGDPAGWYQLGTPAATLTTIAGITVPDGATGMLVQAITALNYGFSPSEALAGTSAALYLPAGGTAFFSGQEHLSQFCILNAASGGAFTIQFYLGDIGPIPDIHQPSSSGGIIPPPPPGLSAIITENTIWVMKNGNDATGTRNRMDLPFLTLAAAEAVAQPGDAIVILAGAYECSNIGVGGVTYIRQGADLFAVGGDILINAQNNFSIRGWGSLSSESGFVVLCDNNANVTIDGNLISTTGPAVGVVSGTFVLNGSITANDEALQVNDGVAIVSGDVTSLSKAAVSAQVSTSVISIGGNVSGVQYGIYALGGTVNAENVTSVGKAVYVDPTASVLIRGNVIGTGSVFAVENKGTVEVMGKVVQTGTGIAVKTEGTSTFRGDITTADAIALYVIAGIATLEGKAYSENSYAVAVTDGTCILSGICENNAAAISVLTIDNTTANVQLLGGAYLSALNGAKSISSFVNNPVTVRSYGAYANTVVDAFVVVQGTLTILP